MIVYDLAFEYCVSWCVSRHVHSFVDRQRGVCDILLYEMRTANLTARLELRGDLGTRILGLRQTE